MSKLIKVNKKNKHLVEVVINRPEKLNAMTKPMWIELGKVFKKLSKNKNLRCIIIRGEGGKSFSPGNDIGEFKKQRSGKSSRFGVPIKRLGLTMAAKELEVLLKVTNYTTAMEILFEGRVFGADEAFQKRLVNRVVNDKDVEKEAYKSAELICEGAPKVARWHKQFARNILKNGKVTEKINNLGYKCYDTQDFKIGYQSFLNKTKPKFKNK